VNLPIPLSNRAGLTRARADELARAVGGHATLHHVLEWGFAQKPVRQVEEIVTQDEYTHDILLPLDAPLYLAYEVS